MYFKGIVMEIAKTYALVMRDDGKIFRINKKEGLKIGDSIFFLEEDIVLKEQNRKKYLMPVIAAALLAIIIISPIISKPRNVEAYALLTLDVNPSIQLQIDENKNIVNVLGLNEDSKRLDLESLKGKNIDEGTKLLKEMLEKDKYITNDSDALFGFAFLKDNDDVNYEEDVQKIIKHNFKGMNIVYIKANKDEAKKAEENGVSLGKYKADEELNEDNFEDSIENLSIPEIVNLLKDHSHVLYWNKEMQEELEDELEDRLEEEKDKQEDIKEDQNEKLEDEKEKLEDEQEKQEDAIKEQKEEINDHKDNDSDNSEELKSENKQEVQDNDDDKDLLQDVDD